MLFVKIKLHNTYLGENLSFSKIVSFHLLGFTVKYVFLL